MNKFRNRIVNTLIGLLALCSATVVIAIVRAGESRSAVRIQAADLAQIQGYFELHSNLRQFYAEYGRIVEDADSASKLDFDAASTNCCWPSIPRSNAKASSSASSTRLADRMPMTRRRNARGSWSWREKSNP